MSQATVRPVRSLHAPEWARRVFAGLTWRGMALVALLCVINGTRRTVMALLGDWSANPPRIDDLIEWSIATADSVGSGLLIALPATLAVVATYNLAPRRAVLRYPALALAVMLSSGIGVAAMLVMDGDLLLLVYFFKIWFRYALMCTFFTAVFVFLRLADESAARAREAERARAGLVKRTQEARLKMLQAQIEPHFLFNTLANVRRLYQTEPQTAGAMLDSLMRYLETALPQMRAEGSTLGREAQLAGAYLDIQRIRMGRRLDYAIDLPQALSDVPLPPMMLLTLVENAIKHGLAPLPEGGTLRIGASVNAAGELELRVADTGQGFTQTSGGGTGLANIRARLAALYGRAARLTFSRNAPRGVVATIALPLAAAATGGNRP